MRNVPYLHDIHPLGCCRVRWQPFAPTAPIRQRAMLAVMMTLACVQQGVRAAEPTLGDPAFKPSPSHAVGWRGDGSGVYPGAGPHPMEWSLEKNRNVAWRTPLPGYSNAGPIVVGDLVITLADPDAVIACSLKTGEVVWRTDLSSMPDAIRAMAAELSLAQGTFRQTVGSEGAKGEKTDLFAKLFVKQGKKWADPHGLAMTSGWQQHVSRTMSTPVSDGESIYVKLHVGVVACLDLRGKVRWQRAFRPWNDTDPVSPVLAGGVLVVMGAQEAGQKESPTVGLDTATGKTLWSSTAIKRCSWNAGSPVVLRHPERPIVISAGGTVFDPRDGTVFFPAIGSHRDGGSPGIWGTTVVFGTDDGRGYRTQFNKEHAGKDKEEVLRLMREDSEKKSKEMTNHGIEGTRCIRLNPSASGVTGEVLHHALDALYKSTFNSPLVHPNGCAYFCEGSDKGGTIWVFDITARKLVQTLKIDGLPGIAGQCYNYCPPAATANTFIYSIHGPQKPGGQNQINVCSIGKDGSLKLEHAFTMDRHVASPVFHGNRILFRTVTELVCIGK